MIPVLPENGNPTNKIFADFVNYHITKGGVMVDMGCGNNKLTEDFIGIDPYYEGIDIIKAYMWDTPFENDSVDFITVFSSLEHVPKIFVLPSLQEFNRILKPDKSLAIIVPNLQWVMENWIMNQTTEFEMDMIFGTQLNDGEYHRNGFSLKIIKEYFDKIPQLELLNVYDIFGYSQWNYGIIARKAPLV